MSGYMEHTFFSYFKMNNSQLFKKYMPLTKKKIDSKVF